MTPILGIMASSISGSKAITNSYESIATLSGTGASGTISFTSIPSTFSHLQLRVLGRSDSAAAAGTITVYPNGNTTAANYARHRLSTDGATVTAAGAGSGLMQLGRVTAASAAANIMGVTIIDIVDYASTTKYKTFRSFSGHDQNGSGDLWITSGLYMSLTAINRVDLVIGGNWTTATTIGLYGIKG
jgi:hypothetical protein